jgi:hypothetical protein
MEQTSAGIGLDHHGRACLGHRPETLWPLSARYSWLARRNWLPTTGVRQEGPTRLVIPAGSAQLMCLITPSVSQKPLLDYTGRRLERVLAVLQAAARDLPRVAVGGLDEQDLPVEIVKDRTGAGDVLGRLA